ncbi:hypothetical protein B0T18DRAFT_405568 [Schizothecium vesticola]|uniref:Uncharacterized protein n=1 Tax=Schizothecium vesticola TaxID=314040 RepID=A0AA40F0G1_9PEZI|nr:hypothetical protein B0T18DRAFT_405568 [Schizothecium vesticola]
MFVPLEWQRSVGVVSREDGGRGKEQQKGFLAAAERADAAALLSQRPYKHIGSYGKKTQKKIRRSSVPAMPLIIHRSTLRRMWYLGRHVFRSKCSLEHVIGGDGKQRFHGPPRSWDVVSASVTPFAGLVHVAPPLSVSCVRGPSQSGSQRGKLDHFPPQRRPGPPGCSATRLRSTRSRLRSYRAPLGSTAAQRPPRRSRPPALLQRCCHFALLHPRVLGRGMPRGQDTQQGARSQEPGKRAPQILRRAGCEAPRG